MQYRLVVIRTVIDVETDVFQLSTYKDSTSVFCLFMPQPHIGWWKATRTDDGKGGTNANFGSLFLSIDMSSMHAKAFFVGSWPPQPIFEHKTWNGGPSNEAADVQDLFVHERTLTAFRNFGLILISLWIARFLWIV